MEKKMLVENKIKNELEKIGYKDGIDFKLLSENKLYNMDEVHIYAKLEAEKFHLEFLNELVDELSTYPQNKELILQGINNLISFFMVDVFKKNLRGYPNGVYNVAFMNLKDIYEKACKHYDLDREGLSNVDV